MSQGVRSLLLSCLAFSLMTVCVKQLSQGGIPTQQTILIRALISLALCLFALRRENISPWGHQKGLLVARGVTGILALFCFFESIANMPLASATVLRYTYPTFTALTAWLWLREPLKRNILAAIVVGWLGITLVARPDWLNTEVSRLTPLPVLVAVLGAMLAGVSFVTIRKLSKTDHKLVIILYFQLVSILFVLPFVITQGVWPNFNQWLLLCCVGGLTQLGQIWLTEGLGFIPAARATSINYVQVVFSTLWAYWIFSEQLNSGMILGGLLVLGSTLISISATNKGETTKT
jgi:drug/metabolite transporter (DMT)-like permease